MELYRTHRPERLEDVAGNEKAKVQLLGMLEKGFPHALLISGPSGSGKTTIARILRKMLKCHDSEYMEIDSVESSGVDTIRELREGLQFQPMFGDTKVFLLDECHRASTTSQDCLLKALENAPKHVYFILATTEPRKLIPTLKNRCVAIEVEALDANTIAKKVLWPVCKKGELDVAKDVLLAIGGHCGGSPRSALTMLERIIALPAEQRLSEACKEDDGMPTDVREVCQALLKGADFKSIAKLVKNVKEEPETVRRMVLGYMGAVLTNSGDKRAYDIMVRFEKNYYDTGKNGILMSCFEVCS